jgi:RNA polymerase sigma-70 factor (ECF subfamily)
VDDDKIIEGLVKGDEGAAQAFVAKYQARIAWRLHQLGVADADCDDLVQEVLLDAWRQLSQGRFRQRSQLFSWLYTIINGKAKNLSRYAVSRGLDRAVPLEDSLHAPTAENQESRLIAQQALAALPVRLQYVFRLRYRERQSEAQIAQHLGVTIKTVKNLLSNAKRAFATAVRGHGKTSSLRRLTGKDE